MFCENGSVDILGYAPTDGGIFSKSGYYYPIKRYQTFIAPPNCTRFTEVAVLLRSIQAKFGDYLVAELYTTKDGKPSGSVLASDSLSATAGATLGMADPQVAVWQGELRYNRVTPGREYAVVLSVGWNSSATARFEWLSTPVYPHCHFGKWDGYVWVDEAHLLGNGWLRVGVVDADNAIEILHEGASGFTFGQVTDQLARYQTFFARAEQPLIGLDLKLRKRGTGTTHSDVVVEFYYAPAGEPSGFPLASACIPAAVIGNEWTIVNAPLHFPHLFSLGQYAIVLRQRIPNPATYEWAVARANDAASFGKWIGTEWVDESSLGDGWLKVWLMPRWINQPVYVGNKGQGWGFGNSIDEIKRYQTFPFEGVVTGFDLRLRRIQGSTQSDLVAELYKAPGNRPSGSPLATGSLGAFHVSHDWSTVHIPLRSGNLPKGTYALVLGQRIPSAAHYEWSAGEVPGNVNVVRFGKWNGSSWVEESGLGDGSMCVWGNAAETIVDLSHNATTGNGFGNSVDELKRFQTFMLPTAAGDSEYFDLNGVELKVRRFSGADQSDLVVFLYETVNNLPAGLPKASAVVPSYQVGAGWSVVTAPLYYKCDHYGQVIEPGRKYAVVLTQRHLRAARYEWAVGPASNTAQFGKWNGATWVDESGLGDGWLKVHLIKRIGPT